jgi:hypothetical protein
MVDEGAYALRETASRQKNLYQQLPIQGSQQRIVNRDFNKRSTQMDMHQRSLLEEDAEQDETMTFQRPTRGVTFIES